MVIGVVLSGFLVGLMGTVAALTIGLPLWFALLLYPLLGTLGAGGFIAMAMTRSQPEQQNEISGFAVEMQ